MLERELTAEKIQVAVAAHFLARFDAERFDRLLALLRDPLSRRMTEMEIASVSAALDAVEAGRHARRDRPLRRDARIRPRALVQRTAA